MITDEHIKILVIIGRLRRPTREQIARFIEPQMQKRTLQRRIQALVEGGYISAYGAMSERKYSLQVRGARELGFTGEKLPTNYRPSYGIQPPDPRFDTLRQVKLELRQMAEKRGWRVLERAEGKAAILHHLAETARAKTGANVPDYLVTPTTLAIQPDLVMLTDREPVVIIFASPHATRRFWRERIERYAPINAMIRAVAVVFAFQADTVREILSTSQTARRFLLIQHDQLVQLFTRLTN